MEEDFFTAPVVVIILAILKMIFSSQAMERQ